MVLLDALAVVMSNPQSLDPNVPLFSGFNVEDGFNLFA